MATVSAVVYSSAAPVAPSTPGQARRWTWFAGALTILAVGLWATRELTVDDAYITFRYSQNMAAGFGPTWNPGQDPVEGFTNFAWMLWLVPWAWIGAPLPVVAHLTAAACAVGILWILVHEPRSRSGAVVATGCFVVFLPTYIHTMSGLETVPFALVLLRALVLAHRIVRDRQLPNRFEMPALMLAAGMLRPDGVIAVLPAIAVWLASARRDTAAWWSIAAGMIVGATYMTWRWSYFGYPLPNTFYIKTNVEAVLSGRWLEATAALLLPLIVLSASLLLRSKPTTGLLVVVTTAALWTIPALTAPAMDYMARFAWHAFPVLCLAAAWAIDSAGSRRVAIALSAVTVGWTGIGGMQLPDARSMVNYGSDLDKAHVAIGRGLAAADVPPEARTLATSDAGAIPYYSGWESLDYIGLSDEQIAHGTPGTERVLDAAPTVIMVTGRDPDGPNAPQISRGTDVDRVTAGYVQVTAGRMRPDHWQIVFVRPQWADQVRTAVDTALRRADAEGDGRIDLSFTRWLQRVF